MHDDDRAALMIGGMLVLWGALHLSAGESGVSEREGDGWASPAPSAAGVEREVPAGLEGPSDAAERLGGRGRTAADLPCTMRLAPVADGLRVAPALVQADRDEQLGLCVGCVGRSDLDGYPLKLRESLHVARVGVQPE